MGGRVDDQRWKYWRGALGLDVRVGEEKSKTCKGNADELRVCSPRLVSLSVPG